MQKLTTLKFETVKHDSKTMDVQPSGAGGLLVIVTGDIFVDGSKNGIKYSEVFHLMKGDNNSFWIHNLVFRLNYCRAPTFHLEKTYKVEMMTICFVSLSD